MYIHRCSGTLTKSCKLMRMQWKNIDFLYTKVRIETWVRHVGARQQMHMEAITFLFYSFMDYSSAGHDYNRELLERKTLLFFLFLLGCMFQTSSAGVNAEMLQSPEIQLKNRTTCFWSNLLRNILKTYAIYTEHMENWMDGALLKTIHFAQKCSHGRHRWAMTGMKQALEGQKQHKHVKSGRNKLKP